MKCPTCGEDVVDLARCENCGTPIPSEKKTQIPAAQEIQEAKVRRQDGSEIEGWETPEQYQVYSLDQDLEFADADALLEDKTPQTEKPTPPATGLPNQKAFGQTIAQQEGNIPKTAAQATSVPRDSTSNSEESAEDSAKRTAETNDNQKPKPFSPVNESKTATGVIPPSNSQAAGGANGVQSRDYSKGGPQPIPSIPFSPQPAQPSGVQDNGIKSNVIYPKTPDLQARKNRIEKPEGLSVGQFQKPAPETASPVSTEHIQAPQTISSVPAQTLEGPASIIHQKSSFNSFVQPETPQQTIHSPLIDDPGSSAGEVTSYDFQPSIYYKQALGDSTADSSFHREDVYAQKIENQPETEKEEKIIPPSFARSFSKTDSSGFKTESPTRPSSVQSAYQSAKPRRNDYQDKNRNKIISLIFQIAFIFLAVSSFFLMNVLETITTGLNPYDQLKTMRYLVFILIIIASISSLFIKNLAGRLTILIPLMLIITGLFLYGTNSLKIAIKPDKTSNFFIIKTANPITIVEDDSFDATEPAISSNGKQALYSKMVYGAESPAHRIGLIEFGATGKDITYNLKDTKLAVNGNFQWYDDNSIIFSDLKIELPTEMNNPVLMASKNELYFDFTSTFSIFNLQNGVAVQYYKFTSKLPFSLYLKQIVNKSENTILMQLSRIYTSPDKAEYNFTFNQKTGLIAGCYMGGIWLINPASGISKKITRGGDIGYPYLDTWPEFNQEGNKIFFIRTRIGEKIENDILQLDTAASLNADEPLPPASVTNDIYNYLNFSISPGGRFIAAWVFAYQETGATRNEATLVLFDKKLNKHIKIYNLEPDNRTADQFVSNIDWSRKGNFILIQINRLLHSSIKRIGIPEEISAIDKN